MKRSIAFFLLVATIFTTAVFSSCSKKAEELERCSMYSFDYFDTVTIVIGYEKNHQIFDVEAQKIRDMLDEYHKLYDIYNEYDGITNLCTINKLAGSGEAIKADDKIIDLLLYAKEMYLLTDKKVNVAMGSVLSVWHGYREEANRYPYVCEIPTQEELAEAAKHTNIDDVIIDKENKTVMLADPKMSLDVGAIAKGYATQMLAEQLKNDGVSGYILNIGGNISCVGKRGDGEKWVVGIENPDKDEEDNEYLQTLALTSESLVTSGDYQRFYTYEGKNYHHIIDPVTLFPAEYFSSVSILSDDSGLADALSTALFCMSYEQGLELIEKMDGVEAMWVRENDEELYSSGFKKYFKE